MTTYIALLRASNVGGNAKLAMADLRACFGKLGFRDAQTLLQTGNVVFSGAKQAGASLERRLEAEAAKRALGTSSTGRNWNTVLKVATLAAAT